MWALVEFNTGIIVACMPSMVMFVRWVRGDMGSSGNRNPHAKHGSGGAGVQPARQFVPMEVQTRISRGHGSDEYIMQEMEGIVKTTEVLVVETAWGEGSGC